MASPIGEMAAVVVPVGEPEPEEGNSFDMNNNGIDDTTLLCFHCGRRGHGIKDCPDKDKPKSQAGKDASKEYYRFRKVSEKTNQILDFLPLFYCRE